MKYILKIVVGLVFFLGNSLIADVIVIEKNSYKVIEFDKIVKNIKVTDSGIVEVTFIQNPISPLRAIKIMGKDYGNVSLHITFDDNTMETKDIDIVKNIKSVINIVKQKYPEVKITQTNDNIIVDGIVESLLDKDIIKNMFQQTGFDTEKQYIDLTKTKATKKMVRLKLYIAEIDNTKGQTIKNNWSVGFRNFYQGAITEYWTTPSGEVKELKNEGALKNSYFNYERKWYGSQSEQVHNALDTILAQSVSLTGGLTSAANYLTNNFNVGLTLQYLASQGVATILTETTLITTEEQTAKFHAGGEILIKVQGVTTEGLPTATYQSKEYGIILGLLASKIINDEYIDLNIDTKSTKIDWSNAVDNIPGFKNQSIETKVIIRNGSTIVLGGLIDKKEAKNISKIPILGDIPILGHIFRSKDFQNGNSELVFFITPEILEPASNSQTLEFDNMKLLMENRNKEIEDASKISLNPFKKEEKTSLIDKKDNQKTNDEPSIFDSENSDAVVVDDAKEQVNKEVVTINEIESTVEADVTPVEEQQVLPDNVIWQQD